MSVRRGIVLFRPLEHTKHALDPTFYRTWRVVLECGHRKDLPSNDRDLNRVFNEKVGFTECKRCPSPIVIEETNPSSSAPAEGV